MRKFLATIIALNRVTILFFGIVFSLVAFIVTASADVTAVSGSAYGYFLRSCLKTQIGFKRRSIRRIIAS